MQSMLRHLTRSARRRGLVRTPLLGLSDTSRLDRLDFSVKVSGPAAVVSLHRLRQEFYGLAPDKELLCQRLLKESIHEL